MAGTGALLLDGVGTAGFDHDIQKRVWAAAAALRGLDWVGEAVPGMNNLLVTFDPLTIDFEDAAAACTEVWSGADPADPESRCYEIPLVYGGPGCEDLAELAVRSGLTVDEVVHRHSSSLYWVGAIGSMPGYPYLSGLHPSLAWERRPSPRAQVSEGSVMIGGVQAGIMPRTAPSGWRVIGRTPMRLFDPASSTPCLLRPGDTVRFTVTGITA